MGTDDLYLSAEKVGQALKTRHLTLATAESCTGGWVGEAVTAVPGSSQWFDRGFITYTNVSKQEMLGVCAQTLAAHGAVSEQTVREMVAGALAGSHAQVALAVSGIAGPGGAVPGKPVGTVCFAWGGTSGSVVAETRHYAGTRGQVRAQSVQRALEGLLDWLVSQA
ncbi:MAG: CinA family protein [Betaproteobacteria bacterium]|nr:CinA family protein [Betaproteobacteria bacterium]